jgi:ATP-dependent protease Clp ATPase subunit
MKPLREVANLIAGPADVYICNECVGLSAEILAEENQPRKPRRPLEHWVWRDLSRNWRANRRAAGVRLSLAGGKP